MQEICLRDYRLLEISKHQKLLDIRNQKQNRIVSINTDVISISEHLEWVKKLRNDFTKEYFAIIYNGEIVGGVNIFDKDTQPKWGFFFENNMMLTLKSIIPIYFINELFEEYPQMILFAEVKAKNTEALIFNKNLGFEMFNNDGLQVLRLDKSRYEIAKQGFLLKRVIKKIDLYKFKIERYNER